MPLQVIERSSKDKGGAKLKKELLLSERKRTREEEGRGQRSDLDGVYYLQKKDRHEERIQRLPQKG